MKTTHPDASCPTVLVDTRERFCRELHRLRDFDFARLLIIANRQDVEQGNYRSHATPQSILASLAALEVRYRVPVVGRPPRQLRRVRSKSGLGIGTESSGSVRG